MFNTQDYSSSSLLSPKMSEWQGPALYVYNDAVFSEEDFLNLSQIGQGSKLDKMAATGRFGLGFNAVYHFTDLPSLVSGEHIVIFDPHAKFLPGISSQQPGLKIAFLQQDVCAQFPDQFEPYKFYGCDLKSRYEGTLFRFPLRSTATAKRSEIKREVQTEASIRSLLESFRKVALESLLFLRHVTKVSVEVHHRGEVHTLFLAQFSDPGQRAKGVWNQIPAFVSGQIAAMQSPDTSGRYSKNAFYGRLESCDPRELPQGVQVTKLAFTEYARADGKSVWDLLKPTPAPDPDVKVADAGDAALRTVEENLGLLTSTSKEETYIVYEQLGANRARTLAVDAAKRNLKLLPWGGVAARISLDPSVDLAIGNGKAFCFLPLPVNTGLPIHVSTPNYFSTQRFRH
jgi:sacsin